MPLIKAYRGISPRIDPTAFIAEDAVIIGDVTVGAESSIWYGCILRGDVNRIEIGARTNVQDGTIIHTHRDPEGDYRQSGKGLPSIIGDEVTIGHKALIHAATVESRAFIGMGAILLDGAAIAEGGMLAAGALLTPGKRVPAGELWGGSPARLLRFLREEEKTFIPRSAANYVELANSYNPLES